MHRDIKSLNIMAPLRSTVLRFMRLLCLVMNRCFVSELVLTRFLTFFAYFR